ncbi:synaptotagmin-1 [Strongylocentrotus purpuratus]|uniref:Concentrative nucleoside transporter C-terminal domain-containing protein n=1 Tax=Strongylocentrotus purpuratus TaxID=7668 RepID=A0A7M7NYY4_STRPU|nr:synaptotagmin-1 [Strongylocentrotus purpuratus]
MKNKISDVMDKIPFPTWAVVAIAIVAGLILLCCCFCICKKCCCKKRKKKEGKKGLKGAVDLKSVQMLGNSYKEKVRSEVIATYALYGFANIGSVGIVLGALGPMAPSRKGDLAAVAI